MSKAFFSNQASINVQKFYSPLLFGFFGQFLAASIDGVNTTQIWPKSELIWVENVMRMIEFPYPRIQP